MEYSLSQIAPIVLLPFFAFVLNVFIAKSFTLIAVTTSCLAILASFVYSFAIFKDFIFQKYSSDFVVHKVFSWFDLNFSPLQFSVDMGFYLDNMSVVMLLMVTGTASLIHIFSTFYMKHDIRFGRFFVYLSLFTSAMLALVLSDNLLSVFIFWELMGFCSYSLIGFYYEKEGAGNASMKAFMTTRVGDVFFLLGIVAIWTVVGSVRFPDIYAFMAQNDLSQYLVLGIPFATFAGFCIFMGTIGKSAQVPLQVWLPDAMWGPTPCSALIHAATMVAAGVYLSLRIFPILEAGELLVFVAYIGAITAFLAATIALIQTDIKAVLAFSTISQLGYMVLGIGVGAYNASFMHLITHAVFKACLFLAAGSVIHSLHDHHTDSHVQEMPRMGGLRKKLPFTFFAMLLCTLAIAGIPFFSGFVSKDRILGDALYIAGQNSVYYPVVILGFLTAGLTAFYMFRMMFLTFFGEPRDQELYEHTHEEHFSWNQNLPLMILSVFTLGIFYSGSLTGQGLVKIFTSKYEWFQTLIQKPQLQNFIQHQFLTYNESALYLKFSPSVYDALHGLTQSEYNHLHHIHSLGAIISIIVAFLGLFLAYLMYIKKSLNPGQLVIRFASWNLALQNKYYFDHFYQKVLINKCLIPFQDLLARFDLNIFDRHVIDGTEKANRTLFNIAKVFDNFFVDKALVDGTGLSVRVFNVILRSLQSGKIQWYFLLMLIVLLSYVMSWS